MSKGLRLDVRLTLFFTTWEQQWASLKSHDFPSFSVGLCPHIVKNSLLDQKLIRPLNLLLDSYVCSLAKSSFSKNPAKSAPPPPIHSGCWSPFASQVISTHPGLSVEESWWVSKVRSPKPWHFLLVIFNPPLSPLVPLGSKFPLGHAVFWIEPFVPPSV